MVAGLPSRLHSRSVLTEMAITGLHSDFSDRTCILWNLEVPFSSETQMILPLPLPRGAHLRRKWKEGEVTCWVALVLMLMLVI